MRTWINIDYLLHPTKEVLFLQELYKSKNYDLIIGIESTTNHKTFNFIDRRTHAFLKHNKTLEINKVKQKTVWFKVELWSRGDLCEYCECSNNSVNIHIYSKTHETYKRLSRISMFSTGYYRLYRNKIYKLNNEIKIIDLNSWWAYNKLALKYKIKIIKNGNKFSNGHQ